MCSIHYYVLDDLVIMTGNSPATPVLTGIDPLDPQEALAYTDQPVSRYWMGVKTYAIFEGISIL